MNKRGRRSVLRKYFAANIMAVFLAVSCCYSEDTFVLGAKIDSYTPGLCPVNIGLIQCGLILEDNNIPHAEKFIKRQGDTLTIFLEKEDQSKEYLSNEHVHYFFVDVIYGHVVLVEVFEEGWDAIIINLKDGNSLRLPGLPLFNPASNKFAVHAFDLDAGFRENVIKIYKTSESGFDLILEKRNFPKSSGPSSIQWIDGNNLLVDITKLGDAPDTTFLLKPVLLTVE